MICVWAQTTVPLEAAKVAGDIRILLMTAKTGILCNFIEYLESY